MEKYKELSREQLLKIIADLESKMKNKYGLVWDSEKFPEQVVLECENNLPVLKEVKWKKIQNCYLDDNILIQWDNYHALTCLNYTHVWKIDMIYIDPPYNTGNKDFIYNDRFVGKEDSYRHSKWISFINKRLKLAKNLLSDNWVIFISIDDNEFAQLKLLWDKIFGEINFIDNIVWDKKSSAKGVPPKNMIVNVHEYIIAYQKWDGFKFVGLERTEKSGKFKNTDNDPRGPWRESNIKSTIKPIDEAFTIVDPNTGREYTNTWAFSKKSLERMIKEERILWKNTLPKQKEFMLEMKNKNMAIKSNWGVFDAQSTTVFLKTLLPNTKFDNPKPISLMKYLIKVATNKDATILDFMAGSWTTWHAIMDLNREDRGNRKFILCTNNENKICDEVTYPRLKKVIKWYTNNKWKKVDWLGWNLRYFKTSLVKKTNSRNQLKIDITKKCSEMLCLKENIFNLELEKNNFKIFSSNKKNKFLWIYYNFIQNDFENFINELKKVDGEIIIYVFSIDNKINKSLFKWLNARIETIPQKILEIYKLLAKMNISQKSETIFVDFEKANKRIFEEKDKDDWASKLRIVLEKILQKLSQLNWLEIINSKWKDEKTVLLNDLLKKKWIFNQIVWQKNQTFLTIWNKASHWYYNEYNLKDIEDFYKHVQNLIDKFNI
jgi:adenine-specific DNA-methyltransferase